MGNTMGKKRKLGSTSSAKWVSPEVQVKKDGMSPLGRSYSMPVHHAKPKSDNYHVVALTSSTYGILKVDLPKDADGSRTSISQNRAIGTENPYSFQEKLRKFEVPEIMFPKPWSDVDQILSKFKPALSEGRVQESDSLKTVTEEEPETINMWELMEGLEDDARSPFPPNAAPLSPIAPKPATVAKKVRNLETSLSFSAIHTVTEVDTEFLHGAVKAELQAAVESDTLIKGKCYDTPGAGRTNATGGLASTTRHGSGKENASSYPAASTLAPVKPNSSVIMLLSGTRDSKGSKNSSHSVVVGALPNSPNRLLGRVLENSSNKTPAKAVDEPPFARVPSGSKFNHNSSLVPSPRPTVSPRGLDSRSFSASPQVTLHRARSGNAYTSPFGFTTSSSDDSEDQAPPESPLFDPELLASFEKAIEDVTEDDWYRVRRSDAGVASTSGSSSDGDSPLRVAAAESNNNNDSSNNDSTALEAASPSVRTKKLESDTNSRRMAFSKVAPVDFRDVVLQKVVRKADPFDKFESMCPPGGEGRVVIYVTSLRGIRKTFEDCSHMKLVILGYRVAVDERDVSMHADFRQELKDLLGKPMPVPRLFIKGRYIGGAEEVSLLHEDGTLAKLLETMPTQTSWEQCDGCGGHRFVPCSECSGSCKVITEDDQVARCTECNENGLVRCPICF